MCLAQRPLVYIVSTETRQFIPAGAVIRFAAMKISARAQSLTESATLSVARKARELKAAGVDIVDLSVGEPNFPSPEVAVSAATEALAKGFTRYTGNAGIPDLREALASDYRQRHGSFWTTDQVIVTVGAKMALFQLAQALFEEGDEAVVPSPYWVSLPEQVRLAGAEPVIVTTRAEDGFSIRAGALLEAVTNRTRAILLNSPCNPSGGMIDAAELEILVRACADRGLVLIADETYERFVYGGRATVSAAAFATEFPETVVVVGSFSKTYAMTGWRLGYALGPQRLIAALAKIQSHATSNPTSFAMVGALAALRQGEAQWLERLKEFEARRDFFLPWLNRLPGIECAAPAGAFYAFPNVTGCYGDGRGDSTAVAEWFLEGARVAVVPGIAFGYEGHVRMSFAAAREDLQEVYSRLQVLLSGA